MDLRKQIEEKYKEVFKLKKSIEINTLRLVRSAIKDKDIANRSTENKELISNNEILNLLQSLIKQRKDSIQSFRAGGRNDLIDKEEKEIEIITRFLPKQLSEEEIKKLIEKFISENNISSVKDIGKIMNYLKTNYMGSLDMSISGKIAKDLLG